MDQIAIGKFIAKKRREKNYTQENLANKLNVSYKTISKWECGKCMPDYSIIELLCKELNITITELIESEEKETKSITNEEIMEMLIKKEKRCNNKKIAISIIFLTVGIFNIINYFVFKQSMSPFLLGFSISSSIGLIIGSIVLFICYYLKKKKNNW